MKILRPMEYVKSLKSLLPPTANRITSYLPTMNKDVYKNTHCIISGQKKTEYVTTLTYSEDRIVKKTQAYNDSYTTGTTTYSLSEGRIGKARAETDNFDCDTWYYDSEGNMTKYIERYTITMGSVDQEGNTGATVEVLDSTVTTYIWQNGVVKTMHYYPEDNVSNDIITSEFEYYDPAITIGNKTTILPGRTGG